MSKPFAPTGEQRGAVEAMTARGIAQRAIVLSIRNPETGDPIDQKTLRMVFRIEIGAGTIKLREERIQRGRARKSEREKARRKALAAARPRPPSGPRLRTPRDRLRDSWRHARRFVSNSNFTIDDFEKLLRHQKYCHLCGNRFTKANPAEIDHVIALAAGGVHEASNIALAHKSCNSSKQASRTHLI